MSNAKPIINVRQKSSGVVVTTDINSDADEPPESSVTPRDVKEEKEWKNETDTVFNTGLHAPDAKSATVEKLAADTTVEDPSLTQKVVHFSWVSPKLRAKVFKTGSGVYSIEPVKAGETLIVWTGKIVTAEEGLAVMDTKDKHYLLQIGDGFYQAPLSEHREPADWTNHSCDPNAGFGKNSPICLSALRDIMVGEQILFDYGMCETDERLWEPMECMCGSSCCRGLVTAHDWYLYPELRPKYKGFFAPHVQRLIDEDERRVAMGLPSYRELVHTGRLAKAPTVSGVTPLTYDGSPGSAGVSRIPA